MEQEAVGVLVRAFLDEGAVRLILVEATAPAERTRVLHELGPDAARLGAECLVAAALNAAYIKDEEQLTLQLQAERPRCSVYADITAEGAVRARVSPITLQVPDGRLNGILVAIKSDGRKELYRGHTEVVDTTVEQALATHMDASQQVNDVLRIGVKVDDDGKVLQAGGLLLERLPDEPSRPSLEPGAFEERYGWVRDADVFQLLTQLAFGSLGEQPVQLLERRALTWTCRCSVERVSGALHAVSAEMLQEMIDEDHGATVTCHFCNTPYELDEAALRQIRDQVAGR